MTELAHERTAADHALGGATGALAELAVGSDEPVGPLELGCGLGDLVVSRRVAFKEDHRPHALAIAPGGDEVEELRARDVRPLRAADVLAVDEDGDRTLYAARSDSISRLTASRASASFSTCRTRSRVSPKCRPISSSDFGVLSPFNP